MSLVGFPFLYRYVGLVVVGSARSAVYFFSSIPSVKSSPYSAISSLCFLTGSGGRNSQCCSKIICCRNVKFPFHHEDQLYLLLVLSTCGSKAHQGVSVFTKLLSGIQVMLYK